MGGKAKKTIFHETIKSPEHFQEVIDKSEAGGPIAIIDCYLAWCGPCEPMVPNYQTLWFTYDEPEKRLSFWQCPEECLPDDLKAKMALNVIPRYLIFANGKQVCDIKGAKYNELQAGIDQNIPEGPDD